MTRDIKSSAVKAMLRVTMMATIVLALLVGLAGQAWAQEAQRIVPHVTCGDLDPYTRTNPDGTKSGQWYGAWMGYTSTYEANKTLTAGSQYNYFNPGQLNRRQPSNFSPGRHDYVFYVVVERVVSPNLFWIIDGSFATIPPGTPTNPEATALSCGATQGQGPAAPETVTSPASGLGSTEATLNAVVDPKGADTTYRFEYGTGVDYGSSAPAGGGSAPASGGNATRLRHARRPATRDHLPLSGRSDQLRGDHERRG